MLHYDQLIAPKNHGGFLVAPNARELAALANRNAAGLRGAKSHVGLGTLSEVRELTRKRHLPGAHSRPVIMVGHQPGLIHAGVWAKNVVAYRLAHTLSGTALHLTVDSDSPRNLFLRVPIHQENRWSVRSISMGTLRPGDSFEGVAGLGAKDLSRILSELHEAMGQRFSRTPLQVFFDAVRRSDADWVSQMISGRRAIENQFDLTMTDLRIRDAWWGPLASQVLCDAPDFARHYNAAIEDYRARHGVRSPNRPVPPLLIAADRVELPFWLSAKGHPRTRAFVSDNSTILRIQADSHTVAEFARGEVQDHEDIVECVQKRSGWRLRPRALITTLWSRLFLADLFIHGIGGAKYDRITDAIMTSYFRVPVPEIACATATLYLDPNCEVPLSTPDLGRTIREMTWNPQRQPEAPTTPAFHELANRKLAAIQKSNELARNGSAQPDVRKAVYEEIRQLNAQMASLSPRGLETAVRELARTRVEAADRRALCDREYFFALHSREDLEKLLAGLPAGADFARA